MDVFNLAINYFFTKNLYIMTAFVCWRPDETAHLWRSASGVGIRLKVHTELHQPPVFVPHDYHREAMLLDLDCPHATHILQEASSSRAFNYRHSWLLVHNSSYNRSIIDDALEDYEILPDADVVWASPNYLADIYRTKAKHPYLLTDLGLNRNSSRQEFLELWAAMPSTVSRRKDLRRTKLPGASLISQPQHFRGWSDLTTKQIDTFPKLTYPLVWLLAEDLNFHLNLRQVDLYGVLQPNGSFDGLAGLLQRNEVEVGIASIFMRQDRMEVLHFISETLAISAAFIFRQPARSAVSNVFLAPFGSGVWLAAGLVVLAASFLLVLQKAVIGFVHWPSRQLLAPLTLPETFTFAVGTLCQQGFYTTPAAVSVRMVMFSTLFTSLFLFTAYSAKIVNLLQTPSDAIRTLDDLTNSPMRLGVQETTYKKVYFVEAADGAAQRLYQRKILPRGESAYLSVVEGIERVRTEMFAFQVERSSGYDVITKTFTEREKCSLDEIEAFKLPTVCLPVRRFSGYRELFAVRMRWQRETGLMGRVRDVWLVGRPRCQVRADGFVSIGLGDVLPALQVYLLGVLMSIALLGIELSVHSVKKRSVPRASTRILQ